METDVVRGMQVDEKAVAEKAGYRGRRYCFCSAARHKAFTTAAQRHATAGVIQPLPAGGTKHRR